MVVLINVKYLYFLADDVIFLCTLDFFGFLLLPTLSGCVLLMSNGSTYQRQLFELLKYFNSRSLTYSARVGVVGST
jgi:hypothetical protein